jgi:hypothetical protein
MMLQIFSLLIVYIFSTCLLVRASTHCKIPSISECNGMCGSYKGQRPSGIYAACKLGCTSGVHKTANCGNRCKAIGQTSGHLKAMKVCISECGRMQKLAKAACPTPRQTGLHNTDMSQHRTLTALEKLQHSAQVHGAHTAANHGTSHSGDLKMSDGGPLPNLDMELGNEVPDQMTAPSTQRHTVMEEMKKRHARQAAARAARNNHNNHQTGHEM